MIFTHKSYYLLFIFSVTSAKASRAELVKILPDFLSFSSCDPTSDCSTSEQGDKVADPADCHKYYVCVKIGGETVPSDSSISCPDGQYFSPESADCTDETETCTTNCSQNCETECTELYEIVAVPGDCSKYRVCLLGGDSIEERCPDDTPFFDGSNCTDNSATCCDFCSLTCDTVGVEIADPYDCTKFYICIEEGTPSEDVHGSCDTGEIFDASVGGCVEGSSCTPLCGSDTSTLPTQITSSLSTNMKTLSAKPTSSVYSTATNPTVTKPTVSKTTETTTSTGITITTKVVTTVYSTTDKNDNCLSSYECTSDGNFPRCKDCDSSYFNCNGGDAEIMYCSDGTVFNPNPNYPFCLLPENCPYPDKRSSFF